LSHADIVEDVGESGVESRNFICAACGLYYLGWWCALLGFCFFSISYLHVQFLQLSGLEKRRQLEIWECNEIDGLCVKRLTSLPVQYVLGEWDFCGMTLKMKRPVFIPRPETEVCFVLSGHIFIF